MICLLQVLVAEAKAREDKVKEMSEMVEQLKEMCDPTSVEAKAADIVELHEGKKEEVDVL